MVSETKINDTFPESQFLIEDFSKPFRLDRTAKGGGILLYIREDIPCRYIKQTTLNNSYKGFKLRRNLINRLETYVLIIEKVLASLFPADIYLLKVNNRNTRTRCEICSKLTIKTPERRHWRRSGFFIVNFEHISHLVVVFLLLTLNM